MGLHLLSSGSLLCPDGDLTASATAVVSFLYAMRHWKHGGYIRLMRGLVCVVLAGLALGDLLDQINLPDISYVYLGFLIILLALSFINALVEL